MVLSQWILTFRRVAGLDALEEGQGIVDAPGVAAGDVGPLGEVGADRDEHGVEAALGLLLGEILDLVVEGDLDALLADPVDLAIQDVARQAVGRDAEVHHPAGHRPGVADLDVMAHQRQVMGARQAARPGTDDQHPLAGAVRVERRHPAFLQRLVAEEPLDGVDADRPVEAVAVAAALARVIADPAVDRRQRVVLNNLLPGLAEPAGLGVGEPCLDVLARRAGVVTRRQEVDVHRPASPERPRFTLVRQVRGDGEIVGLGHRFFLLILQRPHPPAGPSSSGLILQRALPTPTAAENPRNACREPSAKAARPSPAAGSRTGLEGRTPTPLRSRRRIRKGRWPDKRERGRNLATGEDGPSARYRSLPSARFRSSVLKRNARTIPPARSRDKRRSPQSAPGKDKGDVRFSQRSRRHRR